MQATRIIAAICIVVFGLAAIVLGRVAARDWRQAQATKDRRWLIGALDTFQPAIITGAFAVAALMVLIIG